MNSENRRVDFTITDEDISSVCPMITIDEKDLTVTQQEFIQITSDDLSKAEQEVIRISLRDLPKIVRVGLEDLPGDLNCSSTECFHGTSRQAAEQIRKNGFRVGSGNVMGSGIYFSVGGVSIARSYTKGEPCIIRARVDWGRVGYLDDTDVIKKIGHGGGDSRTVKAIGAGYSSLISSSKYSIKSPAIGIVLGKMGTVIRPPRIEVLELIDPRKYKDRQS